MIECAVIEDKFDRLERSFKTAVLITLDGNVKYVKALKLIIPAGNYIVTLYYAHVNDISNCIIFILFNSDK